MLIISGIFIVSYGDQIDFSNINFPWDDGEEIEQKRLDDPEVTYNIFKYSAKAEDADTAVTSATTRGWFDWDFDGFMDKDEIFTFTEASGVYTSDIELPISYMEYDEEGEPIGMKWFDIWIQARATNYLLTHDVVHITGERNSGGEAKPAGTVYLRYLDDGITYDGYIENVAWDDSSDYNATTYTAADATAEFIIKSAGTASRGLHSQVWEQVDYEAIYGYDADVPYYLHWDDIEDVDYTGDELEEIACVGTFFSIYFTEQDVDDAGVSRSDFDDRISDAANIYFNQFTWDWDELFYKASDDSAFQYDGFRITLDIDAAFAAVKVGFMIDVTMEDYIDSDIPYTTAANAVGTLGTDWDGVI
jgi:hypothetical protein